MTDRARVVFLDSGAFGTTVEPRAIDVECDWVEYDDTAPDDVADRIRHAHVVIANGVGFTREQLAAATELRALCVASTGTDHIDMDYCREAGIEVLAVAEYATHTVSEHAFALILALRRNLDLYLRDMREEAWRKSGRFSLPTHPIEDLHGACLAIVGAGAIGRAVARIAHGFGMEVLLSERKGASTARTGRVPFEEALCRCHVLSLHCPLDDANRHMIGRAEFAAMRNAPLVINCARGGLIDEQALAEALVAGRISGAGLDVASREPIDAASPLNALIGRPDFILTPHVGWASRQAQQSLYDQTVDAALAFVRCRFA